MSYRCCEKCDYIIDNAIHRGDNCPRCNSTEMKCPVEDNRDWDALFSRQQAKELIREIEGFCNYHRGSPQGNFYKNIKSVVMKLENMVGMLTAEIEQLKSNNCCDNPKYGTVKIMSIPETSVGGYEAICLNCGKRDPCSPYGGK